MARPPRPLRSVVAFPVLAVAFLVPKLQLLWWSLGGGLAFLDPHFGLDSAPDMDPDDDLGIDRDFDSTYERLG